MIASHSLGKKPFETLVRVSRYYIDNGIPKNEVRKMMNVFLIQCEPTASVPKWSDTIDAAVLRASKNEAVRIQHIDVTKPEMDRIDALPGKQIKRLAFTLLCLAKYWDAAGKSSEHWVNSKDSDIMRMANINTSIKRQSLMYHNLGEAGMVQFSKKVDNTNVKVCFMQSGDSVMRITDLRNLGYQYLKYHGEPYFECCNCGITTKYKNPQNGKSVRQQKYCPACAVEINTQKRVNAVMRYRGSKKEPYRDGQMFTVYMHETPCSKRYVGVTSTSMDDRWKHGAGYAHNERFYADIQKYGWDAIKHYKILETTDEKAAHEAESFYIQKFQTSNKDKGFNRAIGEYVYGLNPQIQERCHFIEVDGRGNDVET